MCVRIWNKRVTLSIALWHISERKTISKHTYLSIFTLYPTDVLNSLQKVFASSNKFHSIQDPKDLDWSAKVKIESFKKGNWLTIYDWSNAENIDGITKSIHKIGIYCITQKLQNLTTLTTVFDKKIVLKQIQNS